MKGKYITHVLKGYLHEPSSPLMKKQYILFKQVQHLYVLDMLNVFLFASSQLNRQCIIVIN